MFLCVSWQSLASRPWDRLTRLLSKQYTVSRRKERAIWDRFLDHVWTCTQNRFLTHWYLFRHFLYIPVGCLSIVLYFSSFLYTRNGFIYMSTSIFHGLFFFFFPNFLYLFTQYSIFMCFVSLDFFIPAFSTFYLNLVFVLRNLVFSRLSLVFIHSNYSLFLFYLVYLFL